MVKPIPEGYPRVTPYLYVDGATQAIDFYRFTELVPRVAKEAGIRLLTVSPADESLESVFSYLVAAK